MNPSLICDLEFELSDPNFCSFLAGCTKLELLFCYYNEEH